MAERFSVTVLDVSHLDYPSRLTAAALQGLVNRQGPRLFLDYGIYDDPAARRTNEDFLPEELWQSKFRPYLGNQDRHNLDGYNKLYAINERPAGCLDEAILLFRPLLKGAVVWDPAQEDTANIALMFAALENLLVITPGQIEWAAGFNLTVVQDLRGRWHDRVELYSWAYEEFFNRCTAGKIACIEPGWHRTEFCDYVVKEKIFTYSLASKGQGRVFKRGWKLMLALLGGPYFLRNLVYNLWFERRLKRTALRRMSADPEVRLASTIQHSAAARPGAIIFGWHTCRDDEFAFMLLLSANGLRLAPSHLASNFSFHSALPAVVPLKQRHIAARDVAVEPDKTYLTFTLSDGDQLMMMNTAELGNWRRPERGKVPFNWEMQPMLAELAPALLGLFYSTLTPADCLVAGPSGAGYIIPPLQDNLNTYLALTAVACRQADVKVVTSYYPDQPLKIIEQHLKAPGKFTGYLSGYFHMGRKPVVSGNGRIFLCNAWPPLDKVGAPAEEVLAGVRKLVDAPGAKPRFIGVHLFAYRTTLKDVYDFVQSLDRAKVKVVRADEFLIAARKARER